MKPARQKGRKEGQKDKRQTENVGNNIRVEANREESVQRKEKKFTNKRERNRKEE